VFGFVRADYEKNFENHWPNLYAGAYRGQMSPGARNKSGAPPMFAPEFFRKQMYHIEDHL